jgi:hypothetical protein
MAQATLMVFFAVYPASMAAGQAPQAPAQHFDAVIAPLLARHCLSCHQGINPKGKLDLKTRAGAFKGGKNGQVIVPGKVENSLLWNHVQTGHMPPKKPLAEPEKLLVKNWIAAGAVWGADPIDPFRYTTETRAGADWWSLQPVVRPPVPKVKDRTWPANAIDYFVLAALESKALTPNASADRRTLIRRVTYDLIGLPPTPAEVDAFLRDDRPDAYARLVDRLLDSPHYGERWARHWLDVVRFGESNGFEHDELRKNAWRYRDWVITALNDDMPYDEFARLQLAGDVLQPNQDAAVIATGFLVAGGYDSVGQGQQSAAMRAVVRQDELEDIVGTVGQTFLGLTVHCARCHDHKFDPVRQEEYYRLAASLAGVRHGERALGSGKNALDKKAKQLAYACVAQVPEVTHFLVRGEPSRKGPVMVSGGVAALVGVKADFGLAPDAADAERRRAVATWVTAGNNPLFARVLVNRLWQYHFGSGLVDTPSDFGFNGGRPTHPELLDWLAAELKVPKNTAGTNWKSWSLKHLHRLIVTSQTYRQQGLARVEAKQVDAANRLLWRKSPMRLDAEAVRDAILYVAGELNPVVGGPGYQDFKVSIRGATYYYEPADVDDANHQRRTVYRTWARSGRNGLLDNFDCPDPSTAIPKRAVTTTPIQALVLMNNTFVLRMADCFARRLEREAGPNVNRQIMRAYELAYTRIPHDDELAMAFRTVQRYSLKVLCRAIFNSNEFLYVD